LTASAGKVGDYEFNLKKELDSSLTRKQELDARQNDPGLSAGQQGPARRN
jgi:hypothetical protein